MEKEKDKCESPEHHDAVVATEEQSEAIRDVATRVETLTNQIAAKKNRDAYDLISLLISVIGLGGLLYYAYWAKIQAAANIKAANAAYISATSAKTSAAAAQAANQLAQESLLISDSPYVSTKSVLDPLVVGKKAAVHITFVNNGKLGASSFAFVGSILIAKVLPQKFAFPPIPTPTALAPDSPNANTDGVPDSVVTWDGDLTPRC